MSDADDYVFVENDNPPEEMAVSPVQSQGFFAPKQEANLEKKIELLIIILFQLLQEFKIRNEFELKRQKKEEELAQIAAENDAYHEEQSKSMYN